MIHTVFIFNQFGDSLTLKMGEVEPSHGLFITEIEGVGPPKADNSMSKIATQNGEKYNSTRVNRRDITFHFLYLDGYYNGKYVSAEEARNNTYKFFPIGTQVQIIFYTQFKNVGTKGYVASNEPDIFVEPYAGSTITIECPSAWMSYVGDNQIQTETFSDLEAVFEFPEDDYSGAYDNILNQPEYGTLQDDPTPAFEFTQININESHDIYYKGEVETGMIISIYGRDIYETPTIINTRTGERMTINTDVIEKLLNPNFDPKAPVISIGGVDAGLGGSTTATSARQVGQDDEIQISTKVNNKYVHYIRNGITYNVLSALEVDEDNFAWLKLSPGENSFVYTCKRGNLNIDITMSAIVYVQGV